MKALVTGGGGFVGRFLVEQLLDREEQVTVFARGAYPELGELGATLIQGDLQDEEAICHACVGMDVVFHVAAKAGIWGTWESFYGPNVVGTENVIAACHANKVQQLVYTSSPSVVFSGKPQEGIDESCPYPHSYQSLYAHTKAIAEQKVLAANGQQGLLTVSLRPHFIWGPRDTHIVPGFIKLAQNKKLIQIGADTIRKDMSYVEDVALAHLLVADALGAGNTIGGSAYFISQDEPIVFWRWVADLVEALGLPGIQWKLPLWLAHSLGWLMEGMYRNLPLKGEPLLTRFLAAETGQSQYYDISRAKRDWGFQPRFSVAQAFEKTVAYWKQQL